MHVDEKGKMLSCKVLAEDPPGLNFGSAVMKSFANARFIPGFRTGKILECTFQMTEHVSPDGRYRGGVSFR
jgi:hypothetical protein